MNISAQREWLSNRLEPISEEQFVEFMKIVFPDPRTVNQDYEDAKDLIRECVYGDKWHQALRNKRTSRREHHRFGRSHRSKGAR